MPKIAHLPSRRSWTGGHRDPRLEWDHLTREEKVMVTKAVRETLDAEGYHEHPVIVGSSAQFTFETVQLCHDAA